MGYKAGFGPQEMGSKSVTNFHSIIFFMINNRHLTQISSIENDLMCWHLQMELKDASSMLTNNFPRNHFLFRPLLHSFKMTSESSRLTVYQLNPSGKKNACWPITLMTTTFIASECLTCFTFLKLVHVSEECDSCLDLGHMVTARNGSAVSHTWNIWVKTME